MITATPFYEVNEAIIDMGGKQLNECMQCALCTGSCPWRLVDGDFSIRELIRLGQLGLEGYESDDILFGCTTCGVCVERCPRDVAIIDVVRAMRALITGTGAGPSPVRAAIGSCHSNANPWGEPAEKRTEWSTDLAVPTFTPDMDYFLSVCCLSAYEARSRKIAQAVSQILSKAGVRFGIIGNAESCCGESIRKTGDEEGFNRLAEKNIALWGDENVKRIITTSPHCYYTFREEYTKMGSQVEVLHYTEILAKLIQEEKIKFTASLDARVTYHDPCYLGRHSGVYDPPRQILQAIPGVELVEMEHSREDSLCCGGGGGRIWMETPPEKRFSDVRVKEAASIEAKILVTACPYCISMLEDSRKSTNMEDTIDVVELSELVFRAMNT